MEHVLLPACRPPAGELRLPAITDLGPNHSVGFRWNHADNYVAVSEGATLTDGCLDGL